MPWAELPVAVDAGADTIGVNSRNLHTLAIDLAVAEGLRADLPEQVLPIAESGVHGPAEIARLRRAGYRRFLVGSSLMTAANPGALLAAMIATENNV